MISKSYQIFLKERCEVVKSKLQVVKLKLQVKVISELVKTQNLFKVIKSC
jgi:hypothetical protein